jgi:hypothetical protein
MPRQLGRVAVRLARTQARKALHGHAVRVHCLRGNSHGDGEGALQLVAPLDRDRLPALGLDRRAWNRPFEAPDARSGEVAVEPVVAGTHAHGQPAVMLRGEQP